MYKAFITGLDNELVKKILPDGWIVEELGSCEKLKEADLLLIGENADNPFGTLSECRKSDTHISSLILVPPDKTSQFTRGLMFAPGVGYNNKVLSLDSPGITGVAENLARATRQRRSFSKISPSRLPVHTNIIPAQTNFLETFLETAPVGAILLDKSDAVLLVNKKARELFSLSEKKIIGSTLQTFLPPNEATLLSRVIRTPEPSAIEIDLRPRLELILEIFASEVSDNAGNRYTLAVFNDITTRKITGEQLINRVAELKNANRDLEEMAYVISHDLKAPVRGIATLSQWISADFGDRLPPEGKDLLQKLLDRTFHLQELLNAVLHYYRVGRHSDEPETVSLDQVLEKVRELIMVPDHFTIEINPLGEVKGYRILLQQVFLNLINNAIAYNDKKEGRVTITATDKDGMKIVRVTDNGPGIEEKYFGRIFRMFESLFPDQNPQGTGIGLTIVKRIVEQKHGGSVSVESKPGEGATFIVKLPLAGNSVK